MSEKSPRPQRVSLTQDEAATKVGVKLIEAIGMILRDGKVTEKEIFVFRDWLHKAATISEIPGIVFLRNEIAGILEDGQITEAETWQLANAALRVLPKFERDRMKPLVDKAKNEAREAARARKREATTPTPSQLAFLKDLGGVAPPSATKDQISEIIDVLVTLRPTARQRMLLRFWNRADLSDKSSEDVSEWMESFYSEDPDRREAWALWKKENSDCEIATYESANAVPIGVGPKYLARIKADFSLRQSAPILLRQAGLNFIFGG